MFDRDITRNIMITQKFGRSVPFLRKRELTRCRRCDERQRFRKELDGPFMDDVIAANHHCDEIIRVRR